MPDGQLWALSLWLGATMVPTDRKPRQLPAVALLGIQHL